jgi:hypothetical protein
VGVPIDTNIGGKKGNQMSVMSACDRLRELEQERRRNKVREYSCNIK